MFRRTEHFIENYEGGAEMKCEFEYCVYNREWHCIMNEIQIDKLGVCESCELVTIPAEIFDNYKEERLKEIDGFLKK